MARVLVTGASRGMDRALAVELKKRGHEVIATARRVDDLADLDVAGKVALDITDPTSVAATAAAASRVEGPVEALLVAAVQSVFEMNVLGALRVIQAFLTRHAQAPQWHDRQRLVARRAVRPSAAGRARGLAGGAGTAERGAAIRAVTLRSAGGGRYSVRRLTRSPHASGAAPAPRLAERLITATFRSNCST